jgi:cystathionine beta-lyase/cystathionine gamma-synthase
MEGATAGFAFASGMAAVYSTMALLQSGDHIVSSSSVLGQPFIVCELSPSGISKPPILISIILIL